MGWNDPVVGGTALRIPAIESPNFIAGAQGWSLNQDGTAEFAGVTVRGQIIVEDTNDGIFVYTYVSA